MININNVENLTQAYIVAYNTALETVKNPDLAVQIAMNVVATIYAIDKANEPKDPFSQLAMALHVAALKSKEKMEPEEKYDDKT